MKPTVLVISCEHAVNTVPSTYAHLFQQLDTLLKTRQAIDFGAFDLTKQISKTLGCEYTYSTVSRLLIDCNRSLNHSRCFSKFTKHLPDSEKKSLIAQYYIPFRQQTKELIDAHIKKGEQVLHVSIHTFAPVLKKFIPNTGIGLLYDSQRHAEKEVARQLHGLLLQETPAYRIRMNYPFPGNSDSFTTTLRNGYAERDYLGMEMEINQALLTSQDTINEVSHALSHSLGDLLALL